MKGCFGKKLAYIFKKIINQILVYVMAQAEAKFRLEIQFN